MLLDENGLPIALTCTCRPTVIPLTRAVAGLLAVQGGLGRFGHRGACGAAHAIARGNQHKRVVHAVVSRTDERPRRVLDDGVTLVEAVEAVEWRIASVGRPVLSPLGAGNPVVVLARVPCVGRQGMREFGVQTSEPPGAEEGAAKGGPLDAGFRDAQRRIEGVNGTIRTNDNADVPGAIAVGVVKDEVAWGEVAPVGRDLAAEPVLRVRAVGDGVARGRVVAVGHQPRAIKGVRAGRGPDVGLADLRRDAVDEPISRRRRSSSWRRGAPMPRLGGSPRDAAGYAQRAEAAEQRAQDAAPTRAQRKGLRQVVEQRAVPLSSLDRAGPRPVPVAGWSARRIMAGATTARKRHGGRFSVLRGARGACAGSRQGGRLFDRTTGANDASPGVARWLGLISRDDPLCDTDEETQYAPPRPGLMKCAAALTEGQSSPSS